MPKKKSWGRTTSGIELTEDVIEKMVEEAEAGFDVSKLRVRRGPGRPPIGSAAADPFPVRLDPELRRALDERAAADDATASEVIREALRRYLKAG